MIQRVTEIWKLFCPKNYIGSLRNDRTRSLLPDLFRRLLTTYSVPGSVSQPGDTPMNKAESQPSKSSQSGREGDTQLINHDKPTEKVPHTEASTGGFKRPEEAEELCLGVGARPGRLRR